MPYVTSIKRIGFDRGLQEGIQQGMRQGRREGLLAAIELGLELKFGAEGLRLLPEIRAIQDLDRLDAVREGVKALSQITELRRIYA